jgi:asparagine synthase (glutamine-hydrolysing)
MDVRKLPPGHRLAWRKGALETVRYWDMRYTEDGSKTEDEYCREVREVLKSSIETRLALTGKRGEVGAFLSGGVDSTTVVGLLHESIGDRVQAFSIGFAEDRFNEIEYARIAARRFGVKLHELTVSPSDTLDTIPRISAEYDEPFGNSSVVPTYSCVKLARDCGMTAIFAGDGGDELFAGNKRYAEDKKFQLYQRIPLWLRRRAIDSVAGLSGSGIPVLAKTGKYVRRANIPCPDRWFSYRPSRTIPIYEEMLSGELKEVAGTHAPFAFHRAAYGNADASNELNRFMYLDLKAAIADNDILKVTRMSELAGLSVHFPFLCHRLAELSGTIPSHMKMRGFRLRSFFKKAFSGLLPAETVAKKKHGFGLPIPLWLRTEPRLQELANELVLSPRSLQRGYFNKGFLGKLFESHQASTTGFYGTIIWDLMMLELWHRNNWDK